MDGVDTLRVSSADLERLIGEMEAVGESSSGMVDRKFREALPEVVLQLRELAVGAESESVRLKACLYVLERCVGRLEDAGVVVDNPLAEFWGRVEAAANRVGEGEG